VLLETSCGHVVLDLLTESCPIASKNFIKLCKVKYFNNVLFFNVQRGQFVQTGDPTGTGDGGRSVYGMVDKGNRFFQDEITSRSICAKGLVCMSNHGENLNGSQFFITLGEHGLEHLQGKRTIFGHVAEGLDDVIAKIGEAHVDADGRPYRDIRILHTHILYDPFDDIPALDIPASPDVSKPEEETVDERIGYDENINELEGRTAEEIDEELREKEAKSRAVVLEMMGDLPDADAKPPENVLFVCKLNPITQDEDLEIIFSRFGDVKSCEVIKDKVTGDSLQYAFVEFDTEEQCQQAYFKMNNVLIDDRRIKVDFSQSVSKIWNKFARDKRNNQVVGAGQNRVTDRKRPQTERHTKFNPRRLERNDRETLRSRDRRDYRKEDEDRYHRRGRYMERDSDRSTRDSRRGNVQGSKGQRHDRERVSKSHKRRDTYSDSDSGSGRKGNYSERGHKSSKRRFRDDYSDSESDRDTQKRAKKHSSKSKKKKKKHRKN